MSSQNLNFKSPAVETIDDNAAQRFRVENPLPDGAENGNPNPCQCATAAAVAVVEPVSNFKIQNLIGTEEAAVENLTQLARSPFMNSNLVVAARTWGFDPVFAFKHLSFHMSSHRGCFELQSINRGAKTCIFLNQDHFQLLSLTGADGQFVVTKDIDSRAVRVV